MSGESKKQETPLCVSPFKGRRGTKNSKIIRIDKKLVKIDFKAQLNYGMKCTEIMPKIETSKYCHHCQLPIKKKLILNEV
ncbi:hypothetical protein CSQ80_02645 [Cyanobacterium aponinum IPPAS B-1201]|nr:hypothetical protein CSQ80_02645 [Cyanobacterium aponinum IPPAS B-1201]